MGLPLGLVLALAGMVTEWYVTAAGIVVALVCAAGWFREVLPREHHELLPVSPYRVEVTRSKQAVARLKSSGPHQQVQPVESFSLLAGLYGGIAGGLAMIGPGAALRADPVRQHLVRRQSACGRRISVVGEPAGQLLRSVPSQGPAGSDHHSRRYHASGGSGFTRRFCLSTRSALS